MINMPDGWDAGDEDGLAPAELVDLACALRGRTLEVELKTEGFVATVNGQEWDAYGLLSDLLVAIGKEYRRTL